MPNRVSVRREVRLGAPSDFMVPPLDDLAANRSLHLDADTSRIDLGHPEHFSSEYFDTADLGLVRRGVTLQRREGGSVTSWILELPRPTKSSTKRADCRLVELDADHRSPPPALVDLVTAYRRRRPLQPIAHLRTTRITRSLADTKGRLVAQVDDDETVVHRDDKVVARFRLLEVDIGPGASPALLDALVERLRAAGASAPDPLPALVRALGPRALAPAELSGIELGAAATAGEVVQAAMVAATTLLLDHDHVVRLDDDIEGVHQARVASRRLRSHLHAYGALFDAAWAAPLSAELKWLARTLGAVRDCDVLLLRLRHAADDLALKVDRRAADRLIERLADHRAEAQAAAVEALGSARYVALLDELVAAVQAPKFADAALVPAAESLPAQVQRRYRKVRKEVEQVGLDPSDRALHELRIDVKRARYSGEVAALALGGEMKAFAKALAGFGDLLGDHHDASVAEDWLREAARHRPKGTKGRDGRAMALVAGQLIAGQRDERRAMRRDLPAAWERVLRADPWDGVSSPDDHATGASR